MSRAVATGFMLVVMICPNSIAQSGSTVGRIKLATATVRSGPSEQMPAVGTLERGDEVIVHHAEGNDWLAVQAPRGSLSWVSQIHLEIQRVPGDPNNRFPVDAVISPLDNGEVKIAAGTMGDTKPLNVQRTKIPAGTIVRIIGPKVTLNSEEGESGWYPIVPPRDDFRYIPKAAVEMTNQSEQGNFVVKGADLPGTGSIAAASIPNPNAGRNPGVITDPNWPNHPLWRDAERARMDGNFTKAEELYMQLATVANKSGDVKLANLCYERVHMVRELGRSTRSSSSPSTSTDVTWRPGDNAQRSTITNHTGSTPAASIGTTPAKSNTLLGDGILRRVNFQYSNQKVYALTNQKGAIRYYVLLNSLDLDQQVGKWVELNGTVSYPREFGGEALLSATRVESIR